jgi:ABC-type transporter Mla subunit MlaD
LLQLAYGLDVSAAVSLSLDPFLAPIKSVISNATDQLNSAIQNVNGKFSNAMQSLNTINQNALANAQQFAASLNASNAQFEACNSDLKNRTSSVANNSRK